MGVREGDPKVASFSEATALVEVSADVFEAGLPEGWGQGRTLFGGVVGGLALRAAAASVEGVRLARSLALSLVAPLAPGPATCRVRRLRAGSALTHVAVDVEQGGSTRAAALAGFGAARPTGVAIPEPPAPEVPPPEGLPSMPFLPGLTPDFTEHYDYRWTAESLPFSGSKEAHVQGWIRPRGGGPVDTPALVGLLDAWPPPAWSVADRPIPGSSVSWLVTITCAFEPGAVPAEEFWLYDARSSFGCSGYSDLDAKLWDRRGRLVACSRQLFADFVGAPRP